MVLATLSRADCSDLATKQHIASFQRTYVTVALELGYLKGGYVNFGFSRIVMLLQSAVLVT